VILEFEEKDLEMTEDARTSRGDLSRGTRGGRSRGRWQSIANLNGEEEEQGGVSFVWVLACREEENRRGRRKRRKEREIRDVGREGEGNAALSRMRSLSAMTDSSFRTHTINHRLPQ